jgi:hypothetical protein
MVKFTPEEQDALFQALAKELLTRITASPCPECGRSGATHQELQAVRQFLSDNNITASIAQGSLRSIAEKLPFRDPDLQGGIAAER